MKKKLKFKSQPRKSQNEHGRDVKEAEHEFSGNEKSKSQLDLKTIYDRTIKLSIVETWQ